VRAHGLGVEQADDCTQLLLRFNGTRRAKSFPSTQAGVAAASDFLDETVERKSLLPTLHIILDEICSNIVKHSGATSFEVDLEENENPECVKMSFIDDGDEYDPLSHTDPDTTLSAAERPIGGLGIMMVKKMSDSVTYERVGNRNVFTVVKK
jgi:anti-sigma regulatory factor (Ser/Thr protein kinase)